MPRKASGPIVADAADPTVRRLLADAFDGRPQGVLATITREYVEIWPFDGGEPNRMIGAAPIRIPLAGVAGSALGAAGAHAVILAHQAIEDKARAG